MKSGGSFCAIGLVAFGLAAFACSSSDDKSTTSPATGSGGGSSTGGSGNGGGGSGNAGSGTGGGPSGPVTIAITAPADGASVGPGTDYPDYPDVPVAFTVTGFTLKAPGTCAGMALCGHVHLLVDGTACNDVGVPYNNAGAASPLNAGLDYCKKIDGEHTISLELHNDDHSAYKVDGKVVSDSRKITAAAEGGDAAAP